MEGLKSGPLAQLVEQLTFNQWVAGSNPARLTTFLLKYQEVTNRAIVRGFCFLIYRKQYGSIAAQEFRVVAPQQPMR